MTNIVPIVEEKKYNKVPKKEILAFIPEDFKNFELPELIKKYNYHKRQKDPKKWMTFSFLNLCYYITSSKLEIMKKSKNKNYFKMMTFITTMEKLELINSLWEELSAEEKELIYSSKISLEEAKIKYNYKDERDKD
jgi:hypothetical protein